MSELRFARLSASRFVAATALVFVSIAGAGAADASVKSRSHQHSARAAFLGATVDPSDASASLTTPTKAQRHRHYANAGKHRRVRVASLGDEVYTPRRGPSRSVAQSGSGGIVWNAPSGCLNGTLRSVLADVSHIATIRVNSTCRSSGHNAAVGGAHRSYHLTGDAADFRVLGGNSRAVYALLRSNGSLGGIKHYGGGLYHIDTGPRRSW